VPIPARLTLVTIGTRDHERMCAFYKSLGWAAGFEIEGDMTSFLLGGVVLALWPLAKLGPEASGGEPEPAPGWHGVTLACNCDTRDDVDDAFATAIAAGATAITPPADTDWGGRVGYFADPEGNRWEVAWAEAMEFDERGAVTRFG
jgi:catechol 2,3-dioxygenase-like lactoylglutathione lyase family enzyme